MKHKHCEVIKAWAEGKQIQCRAIIQGIHENVFSHWRDFESSGTPGFDDPCAYWRVKPETVRYRVALLRDFNGELDVVTAISHGFAMEMPKDSCFIRWLTEWQEVEV